MKKQLLLSLIAAFLMVLGVNAQNNSYNMVIEMTDGTKINIGPNDIKSISFTDGQLTVSGESIDDIKKEIAALKEKIDGQNTCDCSAEIEMLKDEIANLNTSDLVAMINVLQMQIKSLMDEVEKLEGGNGSNNQGTDNTPEGNDEKPGGNDDDKAPYSLTDDEAVAMLQGTWSVETTEYDDEEGDAIWTNTWEINGDIINEIGRYGSHIMKYSIQDGVITYGSADVWPKSTDKFKFTNFTTNHFEMNDEFIMGKICIKIVGTKL